MDTHWTQLGQEFPEVFMKEPRITWLIEYFIETAPNKVVMEGWWHIPYWLQRLVKEEVCQMLAISIIQEM